MILVASANSMLYKQSLKANNKNLAKALDFSKQDVAALGRRVLELEKEKQVCKGCYNNTRFHFYSLDAILHVVCLMLHVNFF